MIHCLRFIRRIRILSDTGGIDIVNQYSQKKYTFTITAFFNYAICVSRGMWKIAASNGISLSLFNVLLYLVYPKAH